MNPDDFITKVQAYQKSNYALNPQYEEALKRRDIWDRLEEIRDLKTKEVVLTFLNQWKCRLSGLSKSQILERDFKPLKVDSIVSGRYPSRFR